LSCTLLVQAGQWPSVKAGDVAQREAQARAWTLGCLLSK
jgi:hypothetical protein